MAENRCGPVGGDYFKEAVCIDTMRVYDSYADKDCLEDIRLLIPAEQQQYLDCARDVKIRDVEVITVCCDVTDVPFNKGCFTVDLTYFIEVTVDVYTPQGIVPVTGVAIFSKTCVMQGGASTGSKAFSSDQNCLNPDVFNNTSEAPVVTVQVAEPVALHAKVCPVCHPGFPPCRCACNSDNGLPDIINEMYGPFNFYDTGRAIYVSIGLFSIIQMARKVQMLIPAYDFCIPTKESNCAATAAVSPCDVFNAIDFPTDAFFPSKSASPGTVCNPQKPCK